MPHQIPNWRHDGKAELSIAKAVLTLRMLESDALTKADHIRFW